MATAAGSIRIPAASSGLPGLKCTYGRIPKGPEMAMNNLTAVTGCLAVGPRHRPVPRRHQRVRPPRPLQPAPGRGVGARPRDEEPPGTEGGRERGPRHRGRPRGGAGS
ncbi:MAG: amidase family protein [Acidimicrobiia bacterium]|nr:amidase family protein [Acidimicrobiia bacterium]